MDEKSMMKNLYHILLLLLLLSLSLFFEVKIETGYTLKYKSLP
jgi:hypothetical protein